MKRCNCPRYHVMDPGDSIGCPVHDPDYKDPEDEITALRAELERERKKAFTAGWNYSRKWYQSDNGDYGYSSSSAFEKWMSRRRKKS